MKQAFVAIAICSLFVNAGATTEWFGDLRQHMNPPKSPPFYDITYDDNDCPEGISSYAIPDYVYFGAIIAAKSCHTYIECVQYCLSNSRCVAANYYPIMRAKGHCELLSETQKADPRLMRPLEKAVYFEQIKCRALTPDTVDVENSPSSPQKKIQRKSSTVKKVKNFGVDEDLLLLKKISDRVREFNLRFRT